jgi:hypothetical protein
VAFKVTELHAVEGFADDDTVVTVGKPSASAGSAADTTPTTGTTVSTATIAIHRLMFISRPPVPTAAAPGSSLAIAESHRAPVTPR